MSGNKEGNVGKNMMCVSMCVCARVHVHVYKQERIMPGIEEVLNT